MNPSDTNASMTGTAGQPPTLANGLVLPEPRWWKNGLPVYTTMSGVPGALKTRRGLRAQGLSAAGLAPVAIIHNVHHSEGFLYDPAAARPVRPLTPKQQAALAAGRERARTVECAWCEQRVPWKTVEKNERGCWVCLDCAYNVAEAEQAAFDDDRAADRRDAAVWAAGVLADPRAVVLDTETTSLDGFAVEIAVLDVASGTVLFDRRLHPGEPISDGARQVHGISDADVADCPRFAAVAGELAGALRGRRVIIYNADFDLGVLARECRRAAAADSTRATLWTELQNLNTECAMEQYATWNGDWHDYWKNYTWVPLGGGHDAKGDCLTVIERIREMAASMSAGEAVRPDGTAI